MQDSNFTTMNASPIGINSSIMFNDINSSVNLDSEEESRFDASRKNLQFSDSMPRVFVSDSKETLFSRNGLTFGNPA